MILNGFHHYVPIWVPVCLLIEMGGCSSEYLNVCKYCCLFTWVCGCLSLIKIFDCLYIRLYVCMSVCRSVCVAGCQFFAVCFTTWLSIYSFVSSSHYLPVCRSLFLLITLSGRLFVCLSVCLCVYLSGCWSLCLSVCLSIWLTDWLWITLSVCLSIRNPVCHKFIGKCDHLHICYIVNLFTYCLSICLCDSLCDFFLIKTHYEYNYFH